MKTLEELKQENAKLEAEQAAKEPEVTEEVIEEEVVTLEAEEEAVEEETVEAEATDTEEVTEESTEETETELWMQSEEQASQEDSGKFTNSDMASLRRKMKAKAEEKDTEIESLKAEIEALKQGSPAPVKQSTVTRPKLEDFEYDEDKYQEALDAYFIEKVRAEQQTTLQAQQEQQAQAQRQQALDKSLNTHYQRVSQTINEGKLTEQQYQNAETKVRLAFERIAPNQGDMYADELISTLANAGEGSDKVVFYLGRNESELQDVISKLQNNDLGGAMMKLGSLQNKLTSAKLKTTSNAPKPAPKIKGTESTANSSSSLHQKYKRAHANGNTQRAFELKREAKAQNIDTKHW